MKVYGYANATGIAAGETLRLHLGLAADSPSRNVDLQVVCENLDAENSVHRFKIKLDARCETVEGWKGFDWPESYALQTARDWHSGLYSVRDDSGCPILMFTLRPVKPLTNLLVQVSFMTPAAYCNSGGKSLYDYNSTNGVAHEVGFRRPELFAWYEFKLSQWLFANDIQADWCCSHDIHSTPELLDDYDVLLIGGHDEYWTSSMRHQLERFVSRGGRLIVLSGNTGHRQVRLSEDGARMIYYGRADLDPELHHDEFAIDAADPPLNKPVNRFLGAGWEYGAFGIDEKYAAYKTHFPAHWIFDNVFEHAAPEVFCSAPFMHYETDAAHWQMHPQGHPQITGIDGTARNAVVLASADLSEWKGKPGQASMVLSCFGAGWVFHGGSTEWIDALNNDDKKIARITHNVLHKFRQKDSLVWHQVDRFEMQAQPRLMCAYKGELIWVDSQQRLWQRDAIAAPVSVIAASVAAQPALLNARAIAADVDGLWLLNDDGALFSPDRSGLWRCRSHTAPQELHECKGAALCGGVLYALDVDGCVWRYAHRSHFDSNPANHNWSLLPIAKLRGEIRAVIARGLHLLALVATDSRCELWRTNGRFIENSDGWICIAELPANSQAITLIHDLLFLATADGALRVMPSAAVVGQQRLQEQQGRISTNSIGATSTPVSPLALTSEKN